MTPKSLSPRSGGGGGCGGGYWQTVYTENHDAIVGEPHANHDAYVTFTYLADNNTTLGVGLTIDGGATWTASGTVSIAKSSSASSEGGLGIRGPYWAAYVMGQFNFLHQHWIPTCTPYNGTVRVVANAWTGQLTQGAATGQYDGSSPQYSKAVANGWRQWISPLGFLTKVSGNTSTYSAGLNIGPINLSSSTDHTRRCRTTGTWALTPPTTSSGMTTS